MQKYIKTISIKTLSVITEDFRVQHVIVGYNIGICLFLDYELQSVPWLRSCRSN